MQKVVALVKENTIEDTQTYSRSDNLSCSLIDARSTSFLLPVVVIQYNERMAAVSTIYSNSYYFIEIALHPRIMRCICFTNV